MSESCTNVISDTMSFKVNKLTVSYVETTKDLNIDFMCFTTNGLYVRM